MDRISSVRAVRHRLREGFSRPLRALEQKCRPFLAAARVQPAVPVIVPHVGYEVVLVGLSLSPDRRSTVSVPLNKIAGMPCGAACG